MTNLSSYRSLEKIQTNVSTVIYRGQREPEQQPVIIKLIKNQQPTIEETTRLRHEYQILKDLDISGIIKPQGLIKYQDSLALILDNFPGLSLATFIANKKISLVEFLQIAVQLTAIVEELHQKNITHKDIKPANIIINLEAGQVKLINFSIASRLSREKQTYSSNPEWLEGTLAYMSPEQTGRMNRTTDYRTDFYSLGVTFYEMLTGCLPFPAKDSMELIHCHIAKKTVSPHQQSSEIPASVSDIVMKLLAKTAEERYQSAAGLKYDLEFCLIQLETTGKIPNFSVGKQDLAGQLLIPQKLYGREQEVAVLMNAFERVSAGSSEIILVSGYSGVGKSSLVHEIHKPIVRQRGYFINGKFDQFKRNIPYAALIQAFRELIQQLLTESQAHIAVWKEKILEALGDSSQVIIDVIPEVSLITGQQQFVPELGPTESQNRFNRVFKNFIHVFTNSKHPLVLFLDDLQWADSASLKLIQLLITDPDSKYLLLIGAYRDNEVSATHLLIQTLEGIQKTGATISNISLQPLNLADVKQLIADTLVETKKSVLRVEARDEFASLLFNKTAGNPFFLSQLLQSLTQEKLLNFDFNVGLWQWDIKQIQAIGITDKSIVELVAGNIRKLPESTQNLLKLAGCIGNQFNLDMLAVVSETSQIATAANLWAALQAGLILPLNNAYQIPLVFSQEISAIADVEGCSSVQVSYKFLHDRVQQAAYSLISEDQKKETHLRIGQRLLKNTLPQNREVNIFDIVNQLNAGAELIVEQPEKYELASLNLIAGKKAKAATAYEPATRYFNIGLGLLAADSWNHYKLVLDLYVEAVEAEYLNTNFERSKTLSEVVLRHATTLIDKIKVYETQIQSCIAQNQMQEAVDQAVAVLEMLGVLLEAPSELTSLIGTPQQIMRTKGIEKIEDLAKLPEMTDPHKLAAMRILMTTVAPIFIAAPHLFPTITVKMVDLCIQYGNSPLAAYAYILYGWLLCGFLEDIEAGYRFGELALKILYQFNAKELKCKVYGVFNIFINHWKNHARETIEPLLEAIQSGIATGDLEYACYSALDYCQYQLFVGEPLAAVNQKYDEYISLMQNLKQNFHVYYLKTGKQLILNLMDQAVDRINLNGESFNEVTLQFLIDANNANSLFGVFNAKLMLSYLFKDYDRAVENARLALKYEAAAAGLMNISEVNFYYSLALLAQYLYVETCEQQQILNQVENNQEKMKRWAEYAPANYQHKYELVEAEKARVLGKISEAIECYDQAIKGAEEQRYLHEEALSNELAAEFYLSRDKKKIARVYLTDAYNGYRRWGALAKVKDLEERYPQFLSQLTVKEAINNQVIPAQRSITEENLAALDLSTVIKASQAISGEIVFENLLDKLMQTLMENAGAQKGLLFLEKSGKLILAAAGNVETENAIVLPFVTVESYPDLPGSVINYVKRTQETVVSSDVMEERLFKDDAYIVKYQPKSILCLPIIHQGKHTGILYLENYLSKGAFTRDRIQVLSLLCAQVSISIENASFYKDLQTYSQELEIKNSALRQSELREREKATQLEKALHELKNTQIQLVQTEKMSSLGQLVAGVAHEINNPVNFINGNLSYMDNYTQDLLNLIGLYQQHYPTPVKDIQDEIEVIDLEFLIEDLPKMLQSMKIGAERISEIVQTLRNFSRIDAVEVKPVDIHEGIDSTLTILQHRLKAVPNRPNIQIIKEYGQLPPVECYAGQLNQVFMNLLSNAIDALEESFKFSLLNQDSTQNVELKSQNSPTIRIKTELIDNSQVTIRIADNGPGMTEEVRNQLFNPFFTTKSVGKGTGLGLSISYQIVIEKHKGQLKCNSAPGQGAEFIIEIPIRQH